MTAATGKYAAEHADALADIADAGAPTVFSRVAQTVNAATDRRTRSTTTISGSAIQVKGDPNRYRQLSLIESQAPSLLFAPDTYGDLPKEGDTVTWAGVGYTAKDVTPIALDGVVIAARIVIAR